MHMHATLGYALRFIACAVHHDGRMNCSVVGVTGLEASRAPYSKSHARRLKRREKEQLTAGGLGSLKAALPFIAPTTKPTRTTTATIGDRSAGELDAAATTTAAGRFDSSVKPVTITKSKSKQPTNTITSSQLEEAPPPQPTTTPSGQIGEGHGAPLTRSQRRRALYGLIIANCHFAFAIKAAHHLFLLFNFASQESRAFLSTADTFEPRGRCKSIRNYPNACPEYARSTQTNNVKLCFGISISSR